MRGGVGTPASNCRRGMARERGEMGDEASSPRCAAPAVACRRGVAAERDIDGASAWSSSTVSGGAAQWGRGGVKHRERDEVRLGHAIYRARKGKGEAGRARRPAMKAVKAAVTNRGRRRGEERLH